MLNDIVSAFTQGISAFVTSIPTALKTGFLNLIFEDPTATTRVLSDFAKFGLLFAGISMGAGLLYLVVNMVRRKI